MWIVANQLKGVLRFPGFDLELQPAQEADLDALGRERAEGSSQIKLALDSGYLRTVRKTLMLDESEVNRMIEERITSIKANLVSEIHSLVRPAQEVPKV